MYNDEISFSEALRYSGLLQIPEMKRLVTTKVPFNPLPRGRMASTGAVCFLLTSLPKVNGPDAECLCNEIEAEYRNIGNVLYMESLDSTTKRVYIALRNHVNGREVQLPNRIKLRNKVVYVTKMYGFSVKN
jgi:hypothetical protein